MGIFQEMKTIVNVAPITVVARFDGQDTRIPPGESQFPSIAINYAKNQNPIMGTSDPNNPSISGGRYLIRVKGVDDCTPMTREEWEAHCGYPTRMDWGILMEDRIAPNEKVVFKGKDRKIQAKSGFDAGVKVRTPEAFAADEA